MFTVEFITLATKPRITLLCDSSRNLAEHNIRLNGRRIIDVVDLVRADYAVGYYRGNRRNTLTFDVRRDVDLKAKEFRDAEEAFTFALDHGDQFDEEGLVRLTLKGQFSNSVRWFANAFVEAHDLAEVMGVANLYSYTINAGAISKTQPV